MRKLFTVVAAMLATSGVAPGYAQESAAATVSRSYDLGEFEEIAVVGPHHMVVTVGPVVSIRAEGPADTLADTEVEVEDGRLKIHPRDDERRRGDDYWRDYLPATFHITLPRLEAVALVGGGDMRVDRVAGDEFAASLAGAGILDVAELRVGEARFSIAGSGDLAARGSAGRATVSIAGSGNVRAREVASSDATVSIAGSGNAELTVANEARVSIVGSGDVDIAGAARCSVSRMGGGRVRCGGADVAG